jgi:hypothetical protein
LDGRDPLTEQLPPQGVTLDNNYNIIGITAATARASRRSPN